MQIVDSFPSLLIHKSMGSTSFDIIRQIRQITGVKKIGHAGTLDPLATGLLIVLIGKETKKQKEFQGLNKEYIVEATFGLKTNTYDAEGKIVHTCEHYKLTEITRQKVLKTLKTFIGTQKQTVPPFSAVKIKGQKLYEKARRGKIDLKTLPKRKITIYTIELLEFKKSRVKDLPKAKIRVSCSKGTYIRSLIHDLGRKLGCDAYVSALTRTKIGNYRLEEAITVEEFRRKWKKLKTKS